VERKQLDKTAALVVINEAMMGMISSMGDWVADLCQPMRSVHTEEHLRSVHTVEPMRMECPWMECP